MAQVYEDEVLGESMWHEHRFFAVELPDLGWKPASGTRRTLIQKSLIEKLDQLIPAAQEILRKRFYERVDAITASINEGDVPIEAFEAHPFDAVDFFGSVARAKSALEGIPQGYASGLC